MATTFGHTIKSYTPTHPEIMEIAQENNFKLLDPDAYVMFNMATGEYHVSNSDVVHKKIDPALKDFFQSNYKLS
jgi:hypothetical protein